MGVERKMMCVDVLSLFTVFVCVFFLHGVVGAGLPLLLGHGKFELHKVEISSNHRLRHFVPVTDTHLQASHPSLS